jgi:glucan phosphoethanolaminetransferase (alkaline phosphatase superfamily)
MNLLEFIYRWFVSLYGHDLADHLSGYDCNEESFIGSNQYIPLGVIALTIALVIMIVYNYVINSASINKWWHWVIVMLIVGIINLFIGYAWTSNEIPNIGDCLMYLDGDKVKNPNYLITDANAWLFGLANFFVSALFFIVFTFSFKWWSSQCKRTPF